jgi:Flp pilus assembly protein TadG
MRLASTRGPDKRRGVTLVEFSVVCLLCMTLIFGVLEYGRALWIKQVLDNAAREGARFAVVHTHDRTTADVLNYVKSVMVGQDIQLNATIQVYKVNPATGANLGDWTTATFGEAICVQIDGTYRPILSKMFFHSNGVAFQAKSVMYSESN